MEHTYKLSPDGCSPLMYASVNGYAAAIEALLQGGADVQGRLKRRARAVQLFGRLAVVETHTLWYFGHHRCLVVGFDALGIWHFWMFTLFHPFLLFCTHFLPISITSTLFLG